VEDIPVTTSATPSFLTEILEGKVIPARKLAYFRTQLRYALHDVVLQEFLRQEDKVEINQADLARRIGRKPAQISRLLGAPGNWTINTVSDLLLGMGIEPIISTQSLKDRIADQEEWGDSDNIVSPDMVQDMPVANNSLDDNG